MGRRTVFAPERRLTGFPRRCRDRLKRAPRSPVQVFLADRLLTDEEAPAAQASDEASTATPTDGAIPPSLAAKPNTVDSSLDNLAQLQREAAQLQNLFAVNDPDTSYEGRDGSGSIVVNVDSDGRVNDVRLASSWRNSVGAHELGAGVLEAVSNATMQRVAAWGTSVAEHGRETSEGSEPPPEASSSRSAPPPAAPDNQQARKALQNVLSLIEGVEGALDDMEQAVANKPASGSLATARGTASR